MTNHLDVAGFPFENCWYGCIDHFPAGYPDDYMEQKVSEQVDEETTEAKVAKIHADAAIKVAKIHAAAAIKVAKLAHR